MLSGPCLVCDECAGQAVDALAGEAAVGEVEMAGAAGEVGENAGDRGQAPVLHKVEADVERGQVAEGVAGHAGCQLLEEIPAQSSTGEVDLL